MIPTKDRELDPPNEFWGESTNYNNYETINPVFKRPTQDAMIANWDNFNIDLHNKIKEIYKKSVTKQIKL